MSLDNPSSSHEYSKDKDIDAMVGKVVKSIEQSGDSEPDFAGLRVEKSRKVATQAMQASASNPELRHRPGSRLRTYTGVRNPDGALKDETYGGEATIKEGTTIYRNVDTLTYPATEPDPSKRNFPITGTYEADGTFVEKAGVGQELYNEYATDNPEHPKKKYGIEPKEGVWTEGMAQIPSYLVEIPADKGEVQVQTAGGKTISVKGGDFLVVDNLGGGKTSVQAIERGMKEKTYRSW